MSFASYTTSSIPYTPETVLPTTSSHRPMLDQSFQFQSQITSCFLLILMTQTCQDQNLTPFLPYPTSCPVIQEAQGTPYGLPPQTSYRKPIIKPSRVLFLPVWPPPCAHLYPLSLDLCTSFLIRLLLWLSLLCSHSKVRLF